MSPRLYYLSPHWVFHSEASNLQCMGHLTSVEALGFLRVGGGTVVCQGFLGLSVPVYGNGATGVQLPLIAGLGVVVKPSLHRTRMEGADD